MHRDTPPTSPQSYEVGDEDEELIYLGDADEVLGQLEAQAQEEDSDGEEFMQEEETEGQQIEPESDDAILTFSKHTAPVFCGHFHPTENLAVTGGEDDVAYVWSTETGEVMFQCPGHKDSVICAEFSFDGTYLATGDIAGEVQVFKVGQDYKKVWEFSMGDMSWMSWHKASNVLMAGAESGEVYIWRIPSGDCKVLQGNGDKAECAELTQDGKKLAVGYADGTTKLWDIKSSTTLLETVPNSPFGHTEPVISICTDADNNLILSGSIDGKILISGASGAIGNLFPARIVDNDSIEALKFAPNFDEMKLAVSGTIKGKITVWDIPHQSMRCECKDTIGGGVTKILWPSDATIIASTTSGVVKAFDARNGEFQYALYGHRDQIYDLQINRSKNLILTTSEDTTCKLYQMK